MLESFIGIYRTFPLVLGSQRVKEQYLLASGLESKPRTSVVSSSLFCVCSFMSVMFIILALRFEAPGASLSPSTSGLRLLQLDRLTPCIAPLQALSAALSS